MNSAFLAAILLGFLGQDPPARPKGDAELRKVQHKRWVEYYKKVAQGYGMFLGGDREKNLKFEPKPVLLYSNPAGGQDSHGAMFVWTHKGRAEVVGAIWSYQLRSDPEKRSVAHELHSLSLSPIEAKWRHMAWSPAQAGIEPKPIPGAARPAKSTALRLAQMRALARQFAATNAKSSVKRELRLLPQPLYRYRSTPGDMLDGALFFFVDDWDPEVILVIEARQTEDGPKWHFGFARFNVVNLTGSHKGVEVWRYDRSSSEPAWGGPRYRYLAVHGVEIRNAVIK